MKKKIDFSRGTIWYQEAKNNQWIEGCSRLRIIMPNGNCEWMPLSLNNWYFDEFHTPCWNKTSNNENNAQSGKEAFELMKIYDKYYGFEPAVFIGYV